MFAARTLELALPPNPNREVMIALDAGAQAALNSCAAAAQKVFKPELVVDSTYPMEGALQHNSIKSFRK